MLMVVPGTFTKMVAPWGTLILMNVAAFSWAAVTENTLSPESVPSRLSPVGN